MESLKQHLESGKPFELSEYCAIKYNAVLTDKQMVKKEGGSILYSIYKIDARTNTAHAQNKNAWGGIQDYLINTNDVSVY